MNGDSGKIAELCFKDALIYFLSVIPTKVGMTDKSELP
jgi:hypothetical protein